MKFTDLFIKRPVLAIVVNVVILIAGLQSIRALSVAISMLGRWAPAISSR